MTSRPDAYWDELGIAWCAITPEIDVVTTRLKSRLRLQSLLITAAIVTGLTLGVAGCLLGGLTIALGWDTTTWNFVTRGSAIILISVLTLVATISMLPVRAGGAATLSTMIELSIARAQRTLRAIQLGYYACALAAIFGLVGVWIRTHAAGPPKLSPIVDLAILAIFALGLALYQRHTAMTLARFAYLKRALIDDV